MGSEGPTDQETLDTSSLVRLVREGQEKSTIDRLVQQYGPSVMNPRTDGTSLLNSFALLGSFDAVSYLLEKGAGASILQADGSTILHSVVRTTEKAQDLHRSKLLAIILESGNGVPVNHRNNKGWTALKLASKKGLEQCVEVLLNHGADPNIADYEGYLPLHNAVGSTDVVKLLNEYTTNINQQTHGGETPLYLAISQNSTESSLILLEHGADPNIPNKEGITPLFLSSRSENITLVRELLRRKANPNAVGASQGIAPLHWAAHKENTEIALLLIEYGADIQLKDKEGRSPLSLASRDLVTKMIELVAKLRNHPIKLPAPTQLTPLSKAMAACSGGNVTALKALLQSGVIRVNQICDPKNDGTLLHTAVYCGQVGVVAMLLNNGADWKLRDKDGDTILHFACMSENPVGNYIATLKYLLSTPAKTLIDAQNARGDTPLHVAIKCKYCDRAKVLIQQGAANVMVTNNKKEYPLHRACCNDLNIEVVLYLSDLMPDINTQDGDGWTALMYAARSNCPAILKYLLQKKADMDLQQSAGFTALHLAAQEDLPEICNILLSHNANPNINGGDQNVSPLHIAAHKGFKEVCRILAENGADYKLKDSDKDTPLSLTDDEEIKSIIINSYVEKSRVRSNSDPSPSNSPLSKRGGVLQKSTSKEESEPSDINELEVKLKEKEFFCEKMFETFKKLKEDNLMYQSRIWELEGDLQQRELMAVLADLPDDEREFKQRWWMVESSQITKTDKMLNDTSEDSTRFWNVELGAFRMMDVAVKEVYRGEPSSDVKKCFFREVEQLSRLHCPRIVQFIGAFYEPDLNSFGIVLEYMSNGNLFDLIHTHKIELHKLEKCKIIRDVILGMCYLHSVPVLHRALSTRNILLGEHFSAKISDFGFHETKKLSGYVAYLKSKCHGLKKCLFPVYTPPEVFERNEFTKASDTYSFGMVAYELTTGGQPFIDTDPSITLCKLIMKIMMGARPTVPNTLPVECQQNFNKCWDPSPSARPTFPALLQNCLKQLKKIQQEKTDEAVANSTGK